MTQLTPKEEAIQLVEQFKSEIYDVDAVDGGGWDNCRLVDKSVNKVAKECAIICVDRIMKLDCVMITNFPFDNSIEYWQQVKQQILLIN